PWNMTVTWRHSVILADMEVAEFVASLENCVASKALLDIHVKCIQHDFDIGAANPLHVLHSFCTRIHDVLFEPIDDLHIEGHIVGLSSLDRFLHADNASLDVRTPIRDTGRQPTG